MLRKLLPVRVGILYLGASPEPEQRIGVDRELRQIEAILCESPLRDRICLSSVLAVTVDELHRSLLAHHPQIRIPRLFTLRDAPRDMVLVEEVEPER